MVDTVNLYLDKVQLHVIRTNHRLTARPAVKLLWTVVCTCGGSAFCLIGIGVSDKALEWFPIGVVEDKLF